MADKDALLTIQYVGWDADRAVADYWSRIRDQEQVYDTLKVEEGAPFIKVMNVGERIEVNRIEGELRQPQGKAETGAKLTQQAIYSRDAVSS